jgi:hypothetical protein
MAASKIRKSGCRLLPSIFRFQNNSRIGFDAGQLPHSTAGLALENFDAINKISMS